MAKITFIARMTVKPGREQEFIGYCRELEEHVRAHEQGVLAYEFFKLREPNRYAVLESFHGRGHRTSPHVLRDAGRAWPRRSQAA